MRFRVKSLPRLTDTDKKRFTGAFLLFTGGMVLLKTVPLWIWLSFMGAGLVCLGWSMVWQ